MRAREFATVIQSVSSYCIRFHMTNNDLVKCNAWRSCNTLPKFLHTPIWCIKNGPCLSSSITFFLSAIVLESSSPLISLLPVASVCRAQLGLTWLAGCLLSSWAWEQKVTHWEVIALLVLSVALPLIFTDPGHVKPWFENESQPWLTDRLTDHHCPSYGWKRTAKVDFLLKRK